MSDSWEKLYADISRAEDNEFLSPTCAYFNVHNDDNCDNCKANEEPTCLGTMLRDIWSRIADLRGGE